MTFDDLAVDFSSHTSYSQNGINVTFTDGGDHFHTVAGSPGTAGRFYGSDGWPANFATGATFTLNSATIVAYAGTITFTATPGGATATVTATGTLNFPAGFQNITNVTLTEAATNDSNFVDLDNITINVLPPDGVAECVQGAAVPDGYNLIEGTAGNDNLSGTSGKDLIRGLDGNDTIHAYSANDIVCGNAGNDTLYGGSGNDVIAGGTGTDTLNGESGTDRGLDNDLDTTRISIEINV
jgi:Ca2+-binding RTX toxin-like protein